MAAKQKITVLGAGAWGGALAILLARNGVAVKLWGRACDHLLEIQHTGFNKRYLPDVPISPDIDICLELADALTDAHNVLIAVPSHAFREVLIRVQPLFTPPLRLLIASKGIDAKEQCLLPEVAQQIFGNGVTLAVLSGPSFAQEVAMGLPTAVAIASHVQSFVADMITCLHNATFRPYYSTDVIGVALGGSIKNVIAIAVGISDGIGYGANARCALITRGLAESARLGVAMGGRQETFFGLAGVGDLVLTCTDNQSRNRRFGLGLGQGRQKVELHKQIGQVVEGEQNAPLIAALAKKYHVEMPIVEQVAALLQQDITAEKAVEALLSRDVTTDTP